MNSNRNVLPYLDDLTERQLIKKKYTIGDNGHLHAIVSGGLRLLVHENGKTV